VKTVPLITIVLFAIVPVAALAVGSVIASIRRPSDRVRSAIQHFAAGVIFSVVGVELLPAIMQLHSDVFEIAGGFAVGVAFMLVVERYAGAHEHKKEGVGKSSFGIMIPIGIDLFVDGLLIGIGFAAGVSAGKLLVIALAFELLSLGLALSIVMREQNYAPLKAVAVPVALALTTLVGGAFVGGSVLAGAQHALLAFVLSFGAAALLFLVTEQLLVEAHEVGETPIATTMFFGGFLRLLILGMLEVQ
jgi:ZIP family zinc transporter